MANFLATMTAGHYVSTGISTSLFDLTAVNVWEDLFAAVADFDHSLQARRTVSSVTFKSAVVTTRELVFTRSLTSGLLLSAHDWRVYLDCSTRTVERLVGNGLARLAEP